MKSKWTLFTFLLQVPGLKAKFLGNFVTQKGPLPVVNSVAIYAHFQTKKPVVSKSGESM